MQSDRVFTTPQSMVPVDRSTPLSQQPATSSSPLLRPSSSRSNTTPDDRLKKSTKARVSSTPHHQRQNQEREGNSRPTSVPTSAHLAVGNSPQSPPREPTPLPADVMDDGLDEGQQYFGSPTSDMSDDLQSIPSPRKRPRVSLADQDRGTSDEETIPLNDSRDLRECDLTSDGAEDELSSSDEQDDQ